MVRSSYARVAVCLFLCSFAVRVEATSIIATADSFIVNGSVNANNGSSDILRVRKNGHARTLVRFDQAEIAAAVTGNMLQSATLELYVESSSGWSSGRQIDVHRLTTDWEEAEVTWNVPATGEPLWGGGTYSVNVTDSYLQTNDSGVWVSADVTDDVAAFLLSTGNFGWLLKKADEDADGGVVYTSREGTAPNQPKLTLLLTPLSGTPSPTTPGGASATPTPSSTPTATPTPTFTASPTYTIVPGCEPVTPTGTPQDTCIKPTDNRPKACDKIATFPLRSLRDWATCLERNDPDTWMGSPPDFVGSCDVYFADGGSGINACNLQSPSYISEDELQCEEATATCELERALQHCDYKLIYQNECNLNDWALVEEQLAGSLPSSPNNVYRYCPDAWYPCIPWQRDTIFKTINDVWLPFLKKRFKCLGGPNDGQTCLSDGDCGVGWECASLTPSCARQAFRALAESLDDFIFSAGDSGVDSDRKAFWRCEGSYDNVAVKNNCGTCDRGGASTNGYDPDLICPTASPTPQITAHEWDDLCKFLKARYNPFRQACRLKPGDTTSGDWWEIEPTPTAVP